MLRSVLIANRGEIAVRIARACRELGLRSVAVFSEADRDAAHVLAADEAYCIGPAPSRASYLRVDRLVETAEAAGVDGVHPGYGFLAERASFAEAVERAGLVFVGPTAATIAAMGDKTQARRRMRDAGVPIVPGVVEPVQGADEARRVAREIGFPVLLKASAGGGGKGMRVVRREAEIASAFEGAAREAEAAFGDGAVYVERFLDRPRHIEIQVLGDHHGSVIHLGERECSIQRRHQKLVEEAPSAGVSAALRARMGEAAVRAAEAVEYRGAGTVEFLVEGDAFYFLEMNTRLQVEHPVTELVTGLDIVQWQLRIAGGEALPIRQEEVTLDGHAIECRITAEDVDGGFLPATGRIESLRLPGGPGVRWDGGIHLGTEVGLHYDPLLGKLIVHAEDRSRAIERMARALDELAVGGIATSLPFHRRVMREPDFREGRVDIGYVDAHPELVKEVPADGDRVEDMAIALAVLEHTRRARGGSTARAEERGSATPDAFSAWRRAGSPWMEGR